MKSFEQNFQPGDLYQVRQGHSFYLYAEENLLRETAKLTEGDFVFVVSSSDDDNLILKTVTRVGTCFTLSLELAHVDLVVPVNKG